MAKEPNIKLIVGLGNPGSEYRDTRHNAGFWLVDAICAKYGATLNEESKFKGSTGTVSIGGKTLRLLKPSTFMNLSGQSVGALANFYKIDCEEMLVVHDELDIDPGTARLKVGGGHGGHNGLRDIISSLGNRKDFARLRVGIGHPGKASQVANFVLKKASPKEQQYMDDAIQACLAHLEPIARGEWQVAMNTLHSFNANPEARAKAEAAKLAKEKKKQERAAQRLAQKNQQTDKIETDHQSDQEES